ncbi:hypothetical protein Tco_1502950 [Tanacetum coccineum]
MTNKQRLSERQIKPPTRFVNHVVGTSGKDNGLKKGVEEEVIEEGFCWDVNGIISVIDGEGDASNREEEVENITNKVSEPVIHTNVNVDKDLNGSVNLDEKNTTVIFDFRLELVPLSLTCRILKNLLDRVSQLH